MFALTLVLTSIGRGHDGATNGESLSGIYTRYQGRVYMNIPGSGYFLVPGADAGSFAPLKGWDSPSLGKDKDTVYCGSRPIAQLRPEQVRFVDKGYVSDGEHAWYCTWDKKNASYRWWQDFTRGMDEDNPDKARPRDYALVPLVSVNAPALKTMMGAYAQDGEHAYYEGALIPGADGATLQTVNQGWERPTGRTDDHYARDSAHVYFQGTRLPDARPATFSSMEPDSGQWQDIYGRDSATGRIYFGAQPFPTTVDGKDSSALRLLVADRDRANHEVFYNASGLWYWDYRDGALKRGCDMPFTLAGMPNAAPAALAPGVWTDDRNAYMLRGVDAWRHGRSDQSLAARETQLWMLPGMDRARWRKVADLTSPRGTVRGTLWQAGAQQFFAPTVGSNYFFYDALYAVRDLEGLKRDLMADNYYAKVLQDLERLDASTGKLVCRMVSRYPAIWEFWK